MLEACAIVEDDIGFWDYSFSNSSTYDHGMLEDMHRRKS
jgi:hypothetical protein